MYSTYFPYCFWDSLICCILPKHLHGCKVYVTIWFIYTVFCWQALSSFKLRLLWIVPWTLLYEHVFWYICTHTIGYISSSGTTGMAHIPLLLIYFLLYFWPSIRDHFLFAWIPFRIGLLGQILSLLKFHF